MARGSGTDLLVMSLFDGVAEDDAHGEIMKDEG